MQDSLVDYHSKMAQPSRLPREDRLFRHSKRPKWGIGLWVVEERNRRRLRWQDGELRAIRRGFYDLLEPVDPVQVDVDQVFDEIAADHAVAEQQAEAAGSRATRPPVMSFADQVRIFTHLYPSGFGDPSWINSFREPSKGKPRKSHLSVASGRAIELLGEPGTRTVDEAWEAAVEVLSSTSLVSPRRLGRLKELNGERREAFSTALEDVLHGEERYRVRFGSWLKMLRKQVGEDLNWPLATTLPALVHPDTHAAVRSRPVSLQARSVLPSRVVQKRPTARGYRDARRVLTTARRQLVEAGHEPRDLLDVFQFVRETLRPKSQELLKTL